MQGAGCRVQDAGCRVQGTGCRVMGAGWRVEGTRKGCIAYRCTSLIRNRTPLRRPTPRVLEGS